MQTTFGAYYTDDEIGGRTLPDNTEFLRQYNIVRQDSPEATALGERFRARLEAGETLYLMGFLATTHNSGLSLIEASRERGLVILANHEEERFSEVKHFVGYPSHSVQEMKRLLQAKGLSSAQIFGVFYAQDTVVEEQSGMRMLLANGKVIRNKYYRFVTDSLPHNIELNPFEANQSRNNLFSHSPAAAHVYKRLAADMGLAPDILCVQMLHHENHAYFSYAFSPFASPTGLAKRTVVSCIDGAGDHSSVSLFQVRDGVLDLIKRNRRADSLGVYYMLCACLLGGWTALSAEGRYMGAAAWGNGDRLTNPYYRRLREFFHFADDGEVFYNALMAEKDFAALEKIVGPFVDLDKIWHPDAVLNVDDVQHSPITRERVDKAAAVQMVFEDALFHIIADLIHRTQADQLVLCGGTALNCVANMRLMEHFNRDYYRRYLDMDTQLHVWAPPVPSDQGIVLGAPCQFAMLNGARAPGLLPTPFLCGSSPSGREIASALAEADYLDSEPMGNINDPEVRRALADVMAHFVAQDSVIGIFQGEAETGPRALGHRSILSNPCNPKTLEILNSRVKMRERVRPLAPMVTLDEAPKWFELSEGARAGDYDAYNYMVLTAQARPEAQEAIPAVVHFDGTSRIQIVRADNNPLMFDYLKALKPRIGVEVSVNTSLNVGTPIVQTPAQAFKVFQRSKGIDAIFFVGAEGDATMVWAKPGLQARDSEAPRLLAAWRAARVPAAAPVVAQQQDARGILEALRLNRITPEEARRHLEELAV